MKGHKIDIDVETPVKKDMKAEGAEAKTEKVPKPTAEELSSQVAFLTKQVAAAKKEAEEAKNAKKAVEDKLNTALSQYVRLQADFDNFRRRTREADAKAKDNFTSETLKSFLPVLDNFELALAHMKKDEKGAAYVKGFELIQKQLAKILADYGVKEIESEGKAFDPHFHEAVMMTQKEGADDETIASVFQKGYMYKDTVLRPAKVQVVKNS